MDDLGMLVEFMMKGIFKLLHSILIETYENIVFVYILSG